MNYWANLFFFFTEDSFSIRHFWKKSFLRGVLFWAGYFKQRTIEKIGEEIKVFTMATCQFYLFSKYLVITLKYKSDKQQQ